MFQLEGCCLPGTMKNFVRALRYCWPYHRRLIISIVCAVFAAAFWGLSFTAIYPVLTILDTNKNLQDWVDEQIAETNINLYGDPDKKTEGLVAHKDRVEAEYKAIQDLPPGRFREQRYRDKSGELANVGSKLESGLSGAASLRIAEKVDLPFASRSVPNGGRYHRPCRPGVG